METRGKRILVSALFVLGAAMIVLQMMTAGTAKAQSVPGLINYQGRLMDSGGMPVTDLSALMTFTLWDGLMAGSSLWTESQAVLVQDGLYSVMLGDSVPVPASVLNGATGYLEVTVLGETLSPRQRLTAVPYALKAEAAADSGLLDGLDSLDFALALHSHDGSVISSGVVGTSY